MKIKKNNDKPEMISFRDYITKKYSVKGPGDILGWYGGKVQMATRGICS